MINLQDKKKKKGDIRKREEDEVEGFSDDDTEMKKVPWTSSKQDRIQATHGRKGLYAVFLCGSCA